MPRQRTKFDLPGHDEAKAHRHTFLMWPAAWKKYKEATGLKWKSVQFDAQKKKSIPEEPGVYAFIIMPEKSAGLQPTYLVYIGQTTKQTLRERFGQYITEISSGKGRPKLVANLPKYVGYTYFFYAVIPAGGKATPEAIEDQLLGGFVPPFNTEFKGEVGKFVRAFA
ncbi:MAG: hypothetical protein K2W82_09475 [Candidatus Obscuribacterales bacterium]|nr:hypothetical protein [Candidatus Obscuribacterales bacterium]